MADIVDIFEHPNDVDPAFHYHAARMTRASHCDYARLTFLGGHLVAVGDIPVIGPKVNRAVLRNALEFTARGNIQKFPEVPGYHVLVAALAKDRLERLNNDGVDPLRLRDGASIALFPFTKRNPLRVREIKDGVEGGILFYDGQVLYLSGSLTEAPRAASLACATKDIARSVIETPLGTPYKPKKQVDVSKLTKAERAVREKNNAYKKKWNEDRKQANDALREAREAHEDVAAKPRRRTAAREGVAAKPRRQTAVRKAPVEVEGVPMDEDEMDTVADAALAAADAPLMGSEDGDEGEGENTAVPMSPSPQVNIPVHAAPLPPSPRLDIPVRAVPVPLNTPLYPTEEGFSQRPLLYEPGSPGLWQNAAPWELDGDFFDPDDDAPY